MAQELMSAMGMAPKNTKNLKNKIRNHKEKDAFVYTQISKVLTMHIKTYAINIYRHVGLKTSNKLWKLFATHRTVDG